jgi:formylglycine-generating enzyme
VWWIRLVGCAAEAPPPVRPPVEAPPIAVVRIAGGVASLGSPPDEPGRMPDEPVRTVEIPHDLLVMTTEVTQGAWAALLGENPMERRTQAWAGRQQGGCGVLRGESQVALDLPVTCVSWYDAAAFANALSVHDGLAPAYAIEGTDVRWDRASPGWRLPTEAEWEYVARRSGAGPWGRGADGSGLCAFANLADARLEAVLPQVDTAPCDDGFAGLRRAVDATPDASGLVDLVGNAWEWTWDVYAPEPGAGLDPAGPATGDGRVFRGGGWDALPEHARLARRPGALPGNRAQWLGVRLVRTEVR